MMASFDEFEANLKQILATFDLFVNAYETGAWFKNVSAEDVKNSFKIANFVEQAVNDFETKNCLDEFLAALGGRWKKAGRCKTYAADFFKNACDHLLAKLLTTRTFGVSSADIAVRIYTAMFPKERFERMLTDLFLAANSYEAVLNFFVLNGDGVDSKELEARLMLNSWNRRFETGRDVRDVVGEALSDYKIEKSLPTVVRILRLQNITTSEAKVRDVLVETLQLRMMDRSALSKSFWLALFKMVDVNELVAMCGQMEKVLDSVLNFVVYIGSMMNYDEKNVRRWRGDPKVSICPEITYGEVFTFLKTLCRSGDEIRKRVVLRITEAQINTGTAIWTELLRDL